MQKKFPVVPAVLGLIVIGCFGYVGSGLGGMAIASYSADQADKERIFGTPAERAAARKRSYDRNYDTVCPRYAEASASVRRNGLRGLQWCDDYLHLLPQAKN